MEQLWGWEGCGAPETSKNSGVDPAWPQPRLKKQTNTTFLVNYKPWHVASTANSQTDFKMEFEKFMGRIYPGGCLW